MLHRYSICSHLKALTSTAIRSKPHRRVFRPHCLSILWPERDFDAPFARLFAGLAALACRFGLITCLQPVRPEIYVVQVDSFTHISFASSDNSNTRSSFSSFPHSPISHLNLAERQMQQQLHPLLPHLCRRHLRFSSRPFLLSSLRRNDMTFPQTSPGHSPPGASCPRVVL